MSTNERAGASAPASFEAALAEERKLWRQRLLIVLDILDGQRDADEGLMALIRSWAEEE